jgi:hypothetical protein
MNNELIRMWNSGAVEFVSRNRSSASIASVLVSRRLPTTAGQFHSQVKSCGICGGQSGNGSGFLRVLRLPLTILIPPCTPYSSTIRGWYNGPISGQRMNWTQPHPTFERPISRTEVRSFAVCEETGPLQDD